MTFGLSLIALCGGVALAAEAAHRPKTRGLLEGLAGGLIVCGLGLIGMGLPLFR